MPTLILVNGPPASGKSTMAKRYVAQRPLALNLDVDVVRSLLGDWLSTPTDAGLAARALALAMAETHLASGRDVLVPQFLARPEFADQLAHIAARVKAPFVEIALMLNRQEAIEAFAARRIVLGEQSHRDAEALVDQATDADPIGAMYDAYRSMVAQRPAARHVQAIRGDVQGTFERFVAAVSQRPDA